MRDAIRHVPFWMHVSASASITFFGCFVVWYLAFFTPVVSTKSTVKVDGRTFTFTNWSHKTMLANTLCGKPIRDATVIAFFDQYGNDDTVVDNARGHGNGTADRITKWESTGVIPATIQPGYVRIHKRLLYICAGGIVKQVDTPDLTIMLTE